MATKRKETNPFSIKNIYKSIVSPSSTGSEAAKEYLENRAEKHTYVSPDVVKRIVREHLHTRRSHEAKCFNTFSARRRAARMARNSRTGEKIQVNAINVPFFRASKKLKEKIEK